MTNLVRREALLHRCGINNVEITKDKGYYYVLHICNNNVPVPLFQTKDWKELDNYIAKIIQ